MPRYRLLARTQVLGTIFEPGEIVTMPEDWAGPTKVVEHGHDRVDLREDSANAGNRIVGQLGEVPLFELVADDVDLAPHVPVDGVFSPAVSAMAGGTQKMSDERLAALDARNDLSEDELAERDRLRKQKAYLGPSGTQQPGQPGYKDEANAAPQPDASHGVSDIEDHPVVDHDLKAEHQPEPIVEHHEETEDRPLSALADKEHGIGAD